RPASPSTYSAQCAVLFLQLPASHDTYPRSLHDALPILVGQHAHRIGRDPEEPGENSLNVRRPLVGVVHRQPSVAPLRGGGVRLQDRKSTRLNSSHVKISYAVFCLKTKRSPPTAPSGRRA